MQIDIYTRDTKLLQAVKKLRQNTDLVCHVTGDTSTLADNENILVIIDARHCDQQEVVHLTSDNRTRATLVLVIVETQSQFRNLQTTLSPEKTDFLQWPCPECILTTRLGLVQAHFAIIKSGEKIDLAPQLRQGRFQAATESLPSMVAAADPAGDLFVANAAFRAFIGPERLRLAKRLEWQTWVHPDQRPDMMMQFGMAIALHQIAHVTVQVLRSDGVWRWLRFTGSPFFDADETYAGTVVTFEDVTETKMLEERLSDSENMYRELADSVPLKISEIQVDGRVSFRNKASLESFPKDVNLNDASTWNCFIHPDDVAKMQTIWQEAIYVNQSQDIEARFLISGGKDFRWLKVNLAPKRDASGHIASWTCSFMDIDEDIRRTEELRRLLVELQESSAEKRNFLARLSHELRTPLNIVLGHLELLEDTSVMSPTHEELPGLHNIREEAEHILTLLERLPWPGDEPDANGVSHVG